MLMTNWTLSDHCAMEQGPQVLHKRPAFPPMHHLKRDGSISLSSRLHHVFLSDHPRSGRNKEHLGLVVGCKAQCCVWMPTKMHNSERF
jgi:hypothetical protein